MKLNGYDSVVKYDERRFCNDALFKIFWTPSKQHVTLIVGGRKVFFASSLKKGDVERLIRLGIMYFLF